MLLSDELRRRIQARLDRLGLSAEDDVAEVQPVVLPSARYLMKDLPDPHKRIFELQIKDTAEIAAALTANLHSWPIFRSVAVESEEGEPFFVVLRSNERYLKHAIGAPIELQNAESLSTVRFPGNHRKGELPRDLLFKATMIKFIDSGVYAVAVVINHAVFDAVCIRKWIRDFEACLMGSPTRETVPYSLFSKVYSSNVHSAFAKDATAFHLKRLQGVGTNKSSLWPPNERLGDQGPDSSCVGSSSKRIPEAVEDYTVFKQSIVKRIPTMSNFQIQYGVHPAVIVKTAIAIFNCMATNTNVAILTQLLSGRVWPFVGDGNASQLPNPRNIAGPTFASTTDVVKIDRMETIGGLLRRLGSEQTHLNRFAHCPPGFTSLLNSEDQATLSSSRRQILNWLPFDPGRTRQNDREPVLKELEHKRYHVDEPRNQFTWICKLADQGSELLVEIHQSPEIYTPVEVSEIVNQVLRITDALSSVENFDRTVEETMNEYSYS